MEISTINKKPVLITLISLLLLSIIGAWQYVEHRQKQWLKYKQEVENKKAEEITIRVIEGWSNEEIGAYLEKEGVVRASEFSQALKTYNASKHTFLPQEAKADLQGFLYPDTYRLFKSVSDRTKTSSQEASEQIIVKLLDNFGKKLPSDAAAKSQRQGMNLYQAIILASIVENETGRNASTEEAKTKLLEERRIVAGIFYNRLRNNMALESDATINYITGKKDPAVSLADTKIKSPYNTYLYRGLPPTPISNPSFSSIQAVLEPVETDYLYFLHKQPSGEPVYSKTFEEHVENKFKYLK